MSQPPPPARGLPSCLFLVSTAALALEVLQMRLFAFALWHHLAFLVVSIAILGFGAAGALLAAAGPLRRARLDRSLAVASLLFAASALAGPLVLEGGAVDIFGELGGREVRRVLLYYLAFTLPYFFAGYVVALAFTHAPERVGRLYCLNLLGSAAGCFAILWTLGPYGAEGTLLLVAATGALAAFLAAGRGPLKVAAGTAVLAALGALPFAARLFPVPVADSKLLALGLRDPATETVVRKWTHLGRIDLLRHPGFDGLYLFQDGDAPAPMPSLSAPLAPGEIHAAAYAVAEKPRVLVVGVGGGFDVKVALAKGAASITGVEVNPVTLALYEDPRFAAVTGGIADRGKFPQVSLQAAEGRHFIRRSRERWDLIQLSGVDTYTALASGAYVLSESYLYTLEAMHDYLAHLAPGGMVAIIRFAFPAPRETLRVMVMAARALRERGAAEPWRHVAVIRGGVPEAEKDPFTTVTGLGAVLVKESPFTGPELDRLRAWAAAGGHIRDYLPDEDGRFAPAELARLQELIRKDPRYRNYQVGAGGSSPFHAFANALKEGKEAEFLAAYPYDVRPVTDDAPFFFNQHRLASVWSWLWGREGRLEAPKDVPWAAQTPLFQTRPVGLILLLLTLGQLALLAALLIFLPLLFAPRGAPGAAPAWAALLYFSCLGLAYMLLMIPAMQRFGLLLGHPALSVPVIMATFLAGSGLGALTAGRIPSRRGPAVVAGAALAVAAGSALLHLGWPALTEALLPLSFRDRALATSGLLAPLAFAMGFCFPAGIRLLAASRTALVPWAYGVNGAASVLASVLAVLLAMTMGFARVQWLAAGLYLLAAVLIRPLARGAAATGSTHGEPTWDRLADPPGRSEDLDLDAPRAGAGRDDP